MVGAGSNDSHLLRQLVDGLSLAQPRDKQVHGTSYATLTDENWHDPLRLYDRSGTCIRPSLQIILADREDVLCAAPQQLTALFSQKTERQENAFEKRASVVRRKLKNQHAKVPGNQSKHCRPR
jgi:hypothetical protein